MNDRVSVVHTSMVHILTKTRKVRGDYVDGKHRLILKPQWIASSPMDSSSLGKGSPADS
jgi:hypothetical protein